MVRCHRYNGVLEQMKVLNIPYQTFLELVKKKKGMADFFFTQLQTSTISFCLTKLTAEHGRCNGILKPNIDSLLVSFNSCNWRICQLQILVYLCSINLKVAAPL